MVIGSTGGRRTLQEINTYETIYQNTTKYYATATVSFGNIGDPYFNIGANIKDNEDNDIDSNPETGRIGISIPGVATIGEIRLEGNLVYEVEPGKRYSMYVVPDLYGTFRWSLESAPDGITLSDKVGQYNTLTVADTVSGGTTFTIRVSVDGNEKGGIAKTYEVVAGDPGTTTTEPDAP